MVKKFDVDTGNWCSIELFKNFFKFLAMHDTACLSNEVIAWFLYVYGMVTLPFLDINITRINMHNVS